MAIIDGTEDDDVLNGTNKADTIDGGGGDDIINSGAGNDDISGGEGDDQLHAGAGDDELDGGEGNDQLIAGAGDDILTGGNGDDFLNGGGGSDTYRFYFGVSAAQSQTLTYAPKPIDYDAPQGKDGPDGLVSEPEFSQFKQDYEVWLLANGPADVEFDYPQTDPVTSESDPGAVDGTVSSVLLTNNQTRYWEDTIQTGGGDAEITAADGNDVIEQFQNSGPNVDKIEMYGITMEQALELFTYEVGDFDGDGAADDSRISWEGAVPEADGSITIHGSTWADLSSFFASSVVFL